MATSNYERERAHRTRGRAEAQCRTAQRPTGLRMKTIGLTQGYEALVDDADYDRVSAYKWCASKCKTTVYGIRKVKTPEGRTTSQLLHRFVMGVTDPGVDVDHQDHDGLNCQRHNLRKCVRGENDGNRRKRSGASRYKGVSWDSSRGLWRACIMIRKKSKFLGRYADERDAAIVYDAAARENFGIFANCNFPPKPCADRALASMI